MSQLSQTKKWKTKTKKTIFFLIIPESHRKFVIAVEILFILTNWYSDKNIVALNANVKITTAQSLYYYETQELEVCKFSQIIELNYAHWQLNREK